MMTISQCRHRRRNVVGARKGSKNKAKDPTTVETVLASAGLAGCASQTSEELRYVTYHIRNCTGFCRLGRLCKLN
jgi:hypothetical protein